MILNIEIKDMTGKVKSNQKVALITGQDGSCLAEFLSENDYIVQGIKRRAPSFNADRIDHIYQDLILHDGDLADTGDLLRV